MKKIYTAALKAHVVLELLKEEQTLTHLRSEHGVHTHVLRDWKTVAVQHLAARFERRDVAAVQAVQHEKQLEERYAEIGRLTTQVNWLKKSCQHEPQGATRAYQTCLIRSTTVAAGPTSITQSGEPVVSSTPAVGA